VKAIDLKNKTPDSNEKSNLAKLNPIRRGGEQTGVLFDKKQNSGNQPEFQSSIKKRTVNQTVVTY
jgi:hypothetical protein